MVTQRQQEVLHFLRRQMRARGVMPSSREIQHHFGFASQTAAMNHLRALERKGLIQRLPRKARGWSLPETAHRAGFAEIPLLGRIPAGAAEDIDAEIEDTLSLDAPLFGLRRNANAFALRVRGDSMVGAGIFEGDIVILDAREPKDGDIVAALIDGETTLKRFLTRAGRPYLKAENPRYPDLRPARDLRIQGVVAGLIRNFRQR